VHLYLLFSFFFIVDDALAQPNVFNTVNGLIQKFMHCIQPVDECFEYLGKIYYGNLKEKKNVTESFCNTRTSYCSPHLRSRNPEVGVWAY